MKKAIAIITGAILLVASFYGCSIVNGFKTLDEVHGFTGNWTGGGTSYSGPNDAGMPWASRVSYRGVYDDVLVEKKEIFERGGKETLATLSFLGWGWETSHPILLSVSNDGTGAIKEPMTRMGKNTYKVVRQTTNDQGQTISDVIITALKGDTYTVVKTRTIDGASPFTRFEGEYQRASTSEDVDLENVRALVPLSDSTKRISCMAGIYKQKGHFWGSLIDGDESIDLILGGHAMFINFKFKEDAGDGYFGSSLTSWDNDKNRFTGFMVSNDAMAATFHAWLSDDKTQLIYEPLNNKGEGLKDERWHANLNQEADHCLLNVAVDDGNTDKGLYIKFTKVEN